MYKDFALLKNGFPMESVSNGSVLVVKTHEWGGGGRKPFDAAMLLIRLSMKIFVKQELAQIEVILTILT